MSAVAEHARSYGFKRLLGAVREDVAAASVARQHTELEPFGGKAWYAGRCPAPDHEDRDPSFYIYPTENHPGGRFYCYGCGRGGDVLDLYMLVHGLKDYKGALIELAGEYGVLETMASRPASWHRKRERQKPVRDAIERARIKHIRRRAFRVWCEPLLQEIEDPEERRRDGDALWEAMRPVALAFYEGMRR